MSIHRMILEACSTSISLCAQSRRLIYFEQGPELIKPASHSVHAPHFGFTYPHFFTSTSLS